MHTPKNVFLSVAVVSSLVACTKKSEGPKSFDGPTVVTYGDHAITTEQLQHELSQQNPFVRSKYSSLDKKKEFLDGIIKLDLLADEAKKDGFDQDPDVQREYKKSMVNHWIKHKFNDKDGQAALTDADLQAYYDAHKDDYQRPEKVRLQVIFFKTDGSSTTKVKAEAEKDQKDLAERLKKNQVSSFADVARSRSDDDASKPKGGDTDFRTRDDVVKAYGDKVATAVDGLKTPNDISPVVEGTGGLYLVRVEQRQPAVNRAFDQVRDSLRGRVWNEKKNQSFDAMVKDMREKANIKIDEQELAKVDASHPDLTAGAQPPPPGAPHGMPAMGRTPMPSPAGAPGAAPATAAAAPAAAPATAPPAGHP